MWDDGDGPIKPQMISGGGACVAGSILSDANRRSYRNLSGITYTSFSSAGIQFGLRPVTVIFFYLLLLVTKRSRSKGCLRKSML